MMAPIAPAAVEFQIHQVVPAFQINMASKAYKKKRILSVRSAIISRGTQAINMSGVNGDTGQAAMNNMPEAILSPNKLEERFLLKATLDCYLVSCEL